jgi:hypothetical protein
MVADVAQIEEAIDLMTFSKASLRSAPTKIII